MFDQHGLLEIIFPSQMKVFSTNPKRKGTSNNEIFSDMIIRKIPLTAPAIDIVLAANILEKLAHMALNGRSNTQETAAEALGFCWICLTSSRLRFPTRLEILYETKPSIKQEANEELH